MATPFGNNLFVEQDGESETVRSSGLVLLNEEDGMVFRGTVVAAGEGKMLDNGQLVRMRVKVGDRIVYSHFASTEYIKVEDKKLYIVPEHEVRAIL